MKTAFIRTTYAKALPLIRGFGHDPVIRSATLMIGRHISPYCTRWVSSKGRKLLVVSPDASGVANAIRLGCPDVSVEEQDATFKQWVAASFPGVDPQG